MSINHNDRDWDQQQLGYMGLHLWWVPEVSATVKLDFERVTQLLKTDILTACFLLNTSWISDLKLDVQF